MLYLKALHIIFVVTWFAGLFYMPRLLVYIREADEKGQSPDVRNQLILMADRLLYIITWPSAILTFVFGNWVLFEVGYHKIMFTAPGSWLAVKYVLVLVLYGYHFSLVHIFRKLKVGKLKMTSFALRLYNEIPTVLLIAIVMLVVVKSNISAVYGIIGLFVLIAVLMTASYLYRVNRKKVNHE